MSFLFLKYLSRYHYIYSKYKNREPLNAFYMHSPSRFLTIPSSSRSSPGQLSKEYGLLTVAVYISLAFPTFLGCLYSITYLGVTQKDIKKIFEKVKTTMGIPPSPAASQSTSTESHDWDWLPEWAQSESTINFLSNVLLAMGMTKIFAPIKIGLTAIIVPSLGRRLKAMGIIRSAGKKQ